MTREYSSISVETTLNSGINTTATTMVLPSIAAATALLGGVSLAPGNVDIFTVAIDPDTINEEIVYVTNVSGDTLTISRGQAGTGTPGVSGIAHNAGASVKHVLTSSDLIYFRDGVETADAAIPKSVVTAKGDLVTATASATPARLGVGTNGQVLVADSTTATGLRWNTQTATGWTFLTSGSVTSGSTLVVSGLSSYNRIMIGLTAVVPSNNSSYLNHWANSKTETFKGTRIAISDNPPSGTSISQIESSPINNTYVLGNVAAQGTGISITITDNLTSAGKKFEAKQTGFYGVGTAIYTRTDTDTILDTSGVISSVTIGLEFGTATFTSGTYTVWGSTS
jgi:hypothetical protein